MDTKEKKSMRTVLTMLRRYEVPQEDLALLAYSLMAAKLFALEEGKELETFDDYVYHLKGWRGGAGGRLGNLVVNSVANIPLDLQGKYFQELMAALPSDLQELKDLINDASIEAIIREYDRRHGLYETPESIRKLAIELLGISPDDTVADFGTGTGSFVLQVADTVECRSVTGFEIDEVSEAIALIKAYAQASRANIESDNMFSVTRKFTKVFSNYPFRVKDSKRKAQLTRDFEQLGFAGIPRFGSFEWLFNLQLVASTEEDGRAIGIMPLGCARNAADALIREYFVNEGLIKAVIALPATVFAPSVNMQTLMIVFGRNNQTVRFIDASSLFGGGRYANMLDEEALHQISDLMNADQPGASVAVDADTLKAANYSLDPAQYLNQPVSVRDGVPLGELVQFMRRGAALSREFLATHESETPTLYRYIVPGHIEDDMIGEVSYLTEINPAQARYCAQEGDLVLTKNGPVFKVATVHVKEGETVLVSANLYLIRVKPARLNPDYLRAYLASEQGQEQLLRGSIGTTLPNVRIGALEDLLVPVVPLSEQNDKAAEYRWMDAEISRSKALIRAVRKNRLHFFRR